MSEEPKHIELRSDAVREIIGRAPSWLVRRGSLAISLMILILLAGSVWFRYPDKLISPITLFTVQPPVEIVSRHTGLLEHLFIRDSQLVEAGQVLGVLESSVNYYFVSRLEPDLDSLDAALTRDSLDWIRTFVERQRPQSGQLKEEYALFLSALRNYLNYLEIDKYGEQLSSARRELLNTRIHYDRLYIQKQVRQEDLQLAEKQLKRQEELLASGTISPLEYENASMAFLTKKLAFEESRSALSAYQIELDKIERRIGDLEIMQHEEKLKFRSAVRERMTALQGMISEWDLNYVLRTPISGVVTLNSYYTENQVVEKGGRVMTVLRQDAGEVTGKLKLPVMGSGKAKTGQKVLVRLDNYPYMEYGILAGFIERISLVAEQDHFTVEVAFPNGMTSSYGQQLLLTQGMTGQAEIITDQKSFLVRIIHPIKYLLTKNQSIRDLPGS